MRVAVVRDLYLNEWDAGNYYGLTRSGVELVFCGRGDSVPWRALQRDLPDAKYLNYGKATELYKVMDLKPDIIDVPDAHYWFSQELVKRHSRVYVTTFDNLPGKNTIAPAALEALAGAYRFTARSRWAYNALKRDGVLENRIRIIPGAVDTALFCPPANGISDRKKTTVLFVGRLVVEKGLSVLMWALSELPDAELWVVGEGDDELYFRELAGQFKVEDRITWLEQLNRFELAEVYRRARMLVLPSLPKVDKDPYATWAEQFGQVLIEAMATGLPVVGSRGNAIPEVVSSACGLFVDPLDWVKLAEYIDLLIHDDERWEKMSKSARKRAELTYDQDVIAKKLITWYND